MHEDVARCGRHDFQLEFPGNEPQRFLAGLSEHQRLAVLQVQLGLGGDFLGGEVVEHAVVEHDAVLKHFHERRTAMLVRAAQHADEVRHQRVHRPRHEPRAGAEGDLAGRDGVLD